MDGQATITIEIPVDCRQTAEQIVSIMRAAGPTGARIVVDAPSGYRDALESASAIRAEEPERFDVWWDANGRVLAGEHIRNIARVAWEAGREFVGRYSQTSPRRRYSHQLMQRFISGGRGG